MKRSHSWVLLFACLVLLLGHTPPAWAGAWTVPRERWYAEYFYRYLGSKKVFDTEGSSNRRAKTAISNDIRNEWKLEYGVTDWLNVLASIPYISSHYRDDNIDLLRTGIGDIYLRTKLRATTTPLVSSVQFSWKIPGAYDPNKNPIGDGQFDFESRLLLSRAWTFAPHAESLRGSALPSPTHRSVGTRARSQAPVRRATQSLHHLITQSPADPSGREAAMREALMEATLRQAHTRLAHQPSPSSPMEQAWFLHPGEEDSAPFHEAVLGWFEDRAGLLAMAEADAATDGPPLQLAAPRPVRAQEDPSHEPTGESPMDTRYAKVAFVNLEGGFTARTDDPANEFPILLEAGVTPFKRLMLVGTLESVISVKSTHEDTEDFAKWGVRAIVNVWGDGFATIFRTGGPTVNVEVGYNDIFAGRNTTDAFELFAKVGVFF